MEETLERVAEQGDVMMDILQKLGSYLNLQAVIPSETGKLQPLVTRRTQWIQNIPKVDSKRFETLRNA
jgi:hypothetical protein